MKMGQKIGLTDQLLRDICVGDTIQDAKGVEYSIDRYGRAKPLSGGNEVPVKSLKGVEIVGTNPSNDNPEMHAVNIIEQGVKDAGDQRLVDELRSRGWTVVCSKMIEKITYEEITL